LTVHAHEQLHLLVCQLATSCAAFCCFGFRFVAVALLQSFERIPSRTARHDTKRRTSLVVLTRLAVSSRGKRLAFWRPCSSLAALVPCFTFSNDHTTAVATPNPPKTRDGCCTGIGLL